MPPPLSRTLDPTRAPPPVQVVWRLPAGLGEAADDSEQSDSGGHSHRREAKRGASLEPCAEGASARQFKRGLPRLDVISAEVRGCERRRCDVTHELCVLLGEGGGLVGWGRRWEHGISSEGLWVGEAVVARQFKRGLWWWARMAQELCTMHASWGGWGFVG